jgi:hypothetical protein
MQTERVHSLPRRRAFGWQPAIAGTDRAQTGRVGKRQNTWWLDPFDQVWRLHHGCRAEGTLQSDYQGGRIVEDILRRVYRDYPHRRGIVYKGASNAPELISPC